MSDENETDESDSVQYTRVPMLQTVILCLRDAWGIWVGGGGGGGGEIDN